MIWNCVSAIGVRMQRGWFPGWRLAIVGSQQAPVDALVK